MKEREKKREREKRKENKETDERKRWKRKKKGEIINGDLGALMRRKGESEKEHIEEELNGKEKKGG